MFNRTFFKSFIRLTLALMLIFLTSSNVNYQKAYAVTEAQVLSNFIMWSGNSPSNLVYMYSTDGITVQTGDVVPSYARWATLSSFGIYGGEAGMPSSFLPIINRVYMYSIDGIAVQTGDVVPGNARWAVLSNFELWFWGSYASINNQEYMYTIDGTTILKGTSVPAGAKWATLSSFDHAAPPYGIPIPILNQIYSSYIMRTAPNLTMTTSDNQGLSEVPGHHILDLAGTVNDPDVGDTVLVKYTIDGLAAHTNKTIATITADGTNQGYSYKLPIDASIPQGSYTYRVWAEDNNGGISTEVVKHFKVDKTPPINSASPEKQETWKTTPITINVSVSDDAAGVMTRQYELTQSPSPSDTWITSENDIYQVIIDTDGEWYLHLNTTDRTGNQRLDTYGPYRYADFSAPTGITVINPTSNTIDVTWNQLPSQEYQVQIKDEQGNIISTSDWEAVAPYKFVDLQPNTRYTPEVRSRKLGIDSGFIQGVAQYTDANPVRIAAFEALDKAIKVTLDIDSTGNPTGTKYVIKNLSTGEQSSEIEQVWTNTGLLNDMSYPYMARVIHRNGKVGEWFLIGTGHTATTEIIVPGDWKDPLGGLTPIKLPGEFDPDTIDGKAVSYNGTVAIVVKGRNIVVNIQNVKNATKYAISLDGFGFGGWKDLDSSGSFTETIAVNQPGLYKVHIKFQNAFGGESPAYVRHFLLDWIKPEIITTQKIKGQTATTNGSFTILGDGDDNLTPVLYYTGSGWQWFTPGADVSLAGISLDNTRKDVIFRFSDLNGNVTTKVYKLWTIQR